MQEKENYEEQIINPNAICKRCGRKLKTPASIELGFGTVCYKRFMAQPILKPLFEVKKHESSGEAEATKRKRED